MKTNQTYERFPAGVVLMSIILSVLMYAIGAYIISRLNLVLMGIYIIYCVWLEYKILHRSCVGCYYYGRVCGFGRGVLCSLMFKKGDPEAFAQRQVSWSDMLPDFMVFIIPVIAGIRLLIRGFSLVILVLMIVLLLLSFAGNAIVRGQYACKYCRQRERGCPADRLFHKKNTAT